jgi:hypothetical protein
MRLSPSFLLALVLFVGLPISAPIFASDAPSAGCTAMPISRLSFNAADESLRVPLRGNLHSLARAEFDQGAVSDSMPMEHLIMLLKRSPEQEVALQTRIDDMHNQHSELFHSWLSPTAVGNCYGVSNTDIAVVTNWLQGHGFKIDSIPAGKTMIVFSGTAGQVREALHTEIHYLNVNGKKHIANMREPELPVGLAPVVAGFRSLHDFFPKPTVKLAGSTKRNPQTGKIELKPLAQSAIAPNSATSGTKPLPSWKPMPNVTYGDGFQALGPQDFYTIYNENPLLQGTSCNGAPCNGAGQTVAVIEETDVCNGQFGTSPDNCNGADDLSAFRSQFGLPSTPVDYMFGISSYCSDPGVQGPFGTGEEIEADLDLQWTNAVAPGAMIDYIACAPTVTTSGVDLAAAYAVNNLASSVSSLSVSYGDCESQLPDSFGLGPNSFYNLLWEQATAQGQTVVISAGDSGDDTCDRGSQGGFSGTNVNGIASTPFNIAAGGTDFSDNYTSAFGQLVSSTYWNTNDTSPYGSALKYVPEMTWNESCGSTMIASLLTFFNAPPGTTFTPEFVCNNIGGAQVDGSGGGGISSLYHLPTWQSVYGVGLTSNYTSKTMRNLPDVSLFAASGLWNHALQFCESDLITLDSLGNQVGTGSGGGLVCDYTNTGESMAGGGTSFVAPQINGLMAIINQRWASGNPAQPTRQGQANYTLYAMANHEYGTVSGKNTSTSAPSTLTCESNYLSIADFSSVFPSCVFHNINRTPAVSTNTCRGTGNTHCVVDGNVMPCFTGTLDCFTAVPASDGLGLLSMSPLSFQPAWQQSAGFSDAVGLGSFNIANLVSNWTSSTWVKPFVSTSSLSASPNTISVAQSTTLTATVTATGRGSLAPPLGTVKFYPGSTCGQGTLLGTVPLSPANNCTTSCNSTASLDVTGLQVGGAGTKSAIACFSGDGANDAPSSGKLSMIVTKANSALTVSSSANPSVTGQAVHLTATVSPATATGSITFRDGSTTIGSATLSSGSATVTTSTLAIGSHTITASYGGDVNYIASTGSLTGNQIVNQGSSTVKVVSSVNPSVLGQSVKFSATVSAAAPATGTPTGTVTFVDTSTSATIGTATLSGGVASVSTAALALGSHTISVSYSGNSHFTAGIGSLTTNPQVVNLDGASVKVTSSLNPAITGQPVKFTITVAAVSPATGTPTGTVTVLDGANPIGTATLSSGIATVTTSALAVGIHTITASYSGNSRFNVSTGAMTTSQTVKLGSLSMTLKSSLNPSLAGQPVTFTATAIAVSPAKGTPTGVVTILDGGSAIGTAPLSGGVATFTTSALAAGSHMITASYGGDANFSSKTASLTGNPEVVK